MNDPLSCATSLLLFAPPLAQNHIDKRGGRGLSNASSFYMTPIEVGGKKKVNTFVCRRGRLELDFKNLSLAQKYLLSTLVELF